MVVAAGVLPTLHGMVLRPLSEGNRLQRLYARWAAPHYARLPAEVRDDIERIDRWLYSRAGLLFWAALLAAVAGTAAGLSAIGVPGWLALACSLMAWFSLPSGLYGAWMQPERLSGRRLLRFSAWMIGGGYLGALGGVLVGRYARLGSLGNDTLWEALRGAAWQATPILLVISLSLLLLLWGVAHTKRLQVQRELQALRLVQERDHAERQAAQAQLKLLQGQIQPHFIFNTLAAVQHWVDTTDPRAGPLLKSLTAFLRGSTELLGREEVTLDEEATIVGHYLQIMQARLGARLLSRIVIAPGLATQPLPPGLLLTLVENAIEHGVAPALGDVSIDIRAQATADGWTLTVRDDGAGLPAGWHEGVGLANCRQRLQHHFGDKARLDLLPLAQGTEARVTVTVAAVRPVTRASVPVPGSGASGVEPPALRKEAS